MKKITPFLWFNTNAEEAVNYYVGIFPDSEIDYSWDKLGAGGMPMACGWLKDKFGLAWQIVPTKFFSMISSDERERAGRVLAAMNTMVKFDIAGLEAAYVGE